MKRFHLLLLIIFGFLLAPANSFACGSQTDNNIEISSKADDYDCCKNNSHSVENASSQKSEKHGCCSKQTKKETNSCGGKCKTARCNCPPLIFSYEFDFTLKIFCFQYAKQNSTLLETPLSSGFYSIWLIPKIG